MAAEVASRPSPEFEGGALAPLTAMKVLSVAISVTERIFGKITGRRGKSIMRKRRRNSFERGD
jgi:hypothetical protein